MVEAPGRRRVEVASAHRRRVARRRQVAHLRLRARLVVAVPRQLPDFLVIGTQRGGTSSLYKWLGRHPAVVPSLRKEVEYFSRWHHRGEAWYRAHFPVRWRRSAPWAGRGPLVTFEATPDYLFHPLAPARAAALVPDARLVALLRDPVERAFSHYRHMVSLGFETLSFEDAIEAEPERLAGEEERLREDPTYDSRSRRLFSYSARGFYADQLARWFDAFPRHRILVVRSEDLYRDPGSAFARILDFLELSPWSPRDFRNYSYRTAPAPEEAVPPAVRAHLEERFRPAGERLRVLLGRQF